MSTLPWPSLPCARRFICSAYCWLSTWPPSLCSVLRTRGHKAPFEARALADDVVLRATWGGCNETGPRSLAFFNLLSAVSKGVIEVYLAAGSLLGAVFLSGHAGVCLGWEAQTFHCFFYSLSHSWELPAFFCAGLFASGCLQTIWPCASDGEGGRRSGALSLKVPTLKRLWCFSDNPAAVAGCVLSSTLKFSTFERTEVSL